jgi:di/tricarboxylate transporter
MTIPGWITIGTIALAAFLIITDRLRPDLTALLVVLTLYLARVIDVEEALSGFSQSAVITILSVFILTAGLERTGATRWASQQVLRLAGGSERRLIGVLTITAAFLAAFMNTIASAAVLLPTSMAIARQLKIQPSRILMTISFGALMGGTTTLLTTANIIVSSTLQQAALEPFQLFDFLPVGLPIVLAGALFMIVWAPKVLPYRDVAGQIARMNRLRYELAQVYRLKQGTSEIEVQPGSNMAGHTLAEGAWGEDLGLTVLGISQKGKLIWAPDRDTEVEEGDTLLLEGAPSSHQMEEYGLMLSEDTSLLEYLASEDTPLIEAILAPRSEFDGRTLKDINFRERYGLQVISLWREGSLHEKNIGNLPLRMGDAMLLQGPRAQVDSFQLDQNFIILGEERVSSPGLKALLSTGVLLGSLVLAAFQILPVAIAMLLGAVMMLLLHCLTMEQAYRAIEWRAIFLIAGMWPLSIALQKTGAAAYLAEEVFQSLDGITPLVAAGGFLVLASITSLVISGQTAAVIVAPIAIATAGALGVDPRALAMATAIGCSIAFLSPLGHPANLLVMAPGGYTFKDYFTLGLPLTILTIVIALFGLQWVWNL